MKSLFIPRWRHEGELRSTWWKVQDVECEVFNTYARWSYNTQTKYRHLRYAPYSASGAFEDMEILLIRAPIPACMKLGRMQILAYSTAARLIFHLSVAAETRG